MHHTDAFPGQLDEEFSRPVETVMKCEDFKSDFARRLSNRYISRLPMALNQQNSLKLRVADNEIVDNAPERIEHCSQLSKITLMGQNDEAVKPLGKYLKNHNIRDTEVSALNMEIETLRWQLSQTEANRQMHIALLKQVVTFLSRIKEHIEHQDPEAGRNKTLVSSGEELPVAVNISDMPRSLSALHVNKHEFSHLGNTKISTNKISKSISNVSGYKGYNGVWNQSKLNLTPDAESVQKMTEEISRLIILANTVLSTKLPDLACKCNGNKDTLQDENICRIETLATNDSNTSLNFIDEDITNAFILNTIYDNKDAFNGLTTKFVKVKDESPPDFTDSSSSLTCGLENKFADADVKDKSEDNNKTEIEIKTKNAEKNSDYIPVTNFIEDESGFSSMSSFQEIGIPIISIIPPSPCKEVGNIDEFTDFFDESEKWKSDSMNIDKQIVKVFWV